ncbi:MAG: V-type ATPase 116kDa subunit family protein [Promethearchaeia archaeon]
MKGQSKMTLIRTLIEKEYKDSLINHLSDIHNVHIKTKSGKSYPVEERKKDENYKKIKQLRKDLKTLFKNLNINRSDFDTLELDKEEKITFKTRSLSELMDNISEELNFYINRINELKSYISKATITLEDIIQIRKAYQFLDQYDLQKGSLSKLNRLGFKVYTTYSKNLSTLKNLFEFSKFPNVHEIEHISEDRIVFYIVYIANKEDELKEKINIIHAEEIQILKKYIKEGGINFERIDKEIELIENRLDKYHKEIVRLRKEDLKKFAAIDEVIQNVEEYDWVQRQFMEVSSSLQGLDFFVPTPIKEKISNKLKRRFKKHITLESIDINKSAPSGKGEKERELKKFEEGGEDESEKKEDLRKEAPTIMDNPSYIRPFETLIKMYGTPSYSEIDPTPFLAISFPLLFGVMFGDIGHGFVLIIAGLLGALKFRKKKGSTYDISWIIFYCGFGAIFGGLFYGAFFGMDNFFGITLHPIFHNPLEDILILFKFAVIIGVIHINLGWTIQLLNYCKQSRKYLAVTESFFKICLLTAGTILIFTWGFDILAWFEFPYPILLTVIPGLILIISKPLGRLLGVSYLEEESYGELVTEGSMETFETLLSIISNVASYIRLLALALTHIALMLSVEAMIGLVSFPENHIVWIFLNQILIITGLIFGNMLVILLEGLIVFLNTIRLHFYEFFFKFYQGSGTEFFPFHLDQDYSIINFQLETRKDIISEEIEKEIETEKLQSMVEEAVNKIKKNFL